MSSTAESSTTVSEFWHLRHVGPPASVENSSSLIRLSVDGTISVGRGPTADFFLDSKVHLRLISRRHAEITGERLGNGHIKFTLKNFGLNGTYVNDFKLGTDGCDRKVLHEGDKVVFGHINSASIQVGAYAPQPQSEFQFILEKVNALIDNHPSLNLDPPCCTNDFVTGIQLPTRGANSEHDSVSLKSNSSASEKENKFCKPPLDLSSNSATSKPSPTAVTGLSGARDKQVAQNQMLRCLMSHDIKETISTSNKNCQSPTVVDDLNKLEREPRSQELKIAQQNTFDYNDDSCMDRECPSVLSKVEDNSNGSLSMDFKAETPAKPIPVSLSFCERNVTGSLLHHCIEKEFGDNPLVKENCCSLSPDQITKIKSFKDTPAFDMTKNDSQIRDCTVTLEKYPTLPKKEADPQNWHLKDEADRTDSLKHFSAQKSEPRKISHKSKREDDSGKSDFYKVEKDEMKITAETVDLKHSPVHSSKMNSCAVSYEVPYEKQKIVEDKQTSKEEINQQKTISPSKTKHRHMFGAQQMHKDKYNDSHNDTSFRIESETVLLPDKAKNSNQSYNNIYQYSSSTSSIKDMRHGRSPMKLENSPAKDHSVGSSLSPSRTSPHSSSTLAPHINIVSSELSPNLSPNSATSAIGSSVPQVSKNSPISKILDRYVPPKDGLFDSSDENSGEEEGRGGNNTPQIIKKIYSPLKRRQAKVEKDVDGLSLSLLPRREVQGLKCNVDVRNSSMSLNEKKDNMNMNHLKSSLSPRGENLDLESNQSKSASMKQSIYADDAAGTTVNFISPGTDRSSHTRSEHSPETNTSKPVRLEKSPKRDYSPSLCSKGLSSSNSVIFKHQLKQETTDKLKAYLKDSFKSRGMPKNKLSSTHDSIKPSHQDDSQSANKLTTPQKTSSSNKVSENKIVTTSPMTLALSASLAESQSHKTEFSKSSKAPISKSSSHAVLNEKRNSAPDSGVAKEKHNTATSSCKSKTVDSSHRKEIEEQKSRTADSSLHKEVEEQNCPENKTNVLKNDKDSIKSDMYIILSATRTKPASAVHKKQSPSDEAKIHQSPSASVFPASPESLSKSATKYPKLKLKPGNHSKKDNYPSADVKTTSHDLKRKLPDTPRSDELAATLKSVKVRLSPVDLKNIPDLMAKSKLMGYKIPHLTSCSEVAVSQPKQTTPSSKPLPGKEDLSSIKTVSSSSDKKWKKRKMSRNAHASDKIKDGAERNVSGSTENSKSDEVKISFNATDQVDKVSSTTDAKKAKQAAPKVNRELDFLQKYQEQLTQEKVLRARKAKINTDASSSEEDELDLVPWSGKPKRSRHSAPSQTPPRRSLTPTPLTSSSKSQSEKPRRTKKPQWTSAKGKKRLAIKRRLAKTASYSSNSDDDDDDFVEHHDIEESWRLPDGVQYFDNPCSAMECRNPSGRAVNWVMCDRCEQWYHLVCVDANLEEVQNENTQFVCGYC